MSMLGMLDPIKRISIAKPPNTTLRIYEPITLEFWMLLLFNQDSLLLVVEEMGLSKRIIMVGMPVMVVV